MLIVFFYVHRDTTFRTVYNCVWPVKFKYIIILWCLNFKLNQKEKKNLNFKQHLIIDNYDKDKQHYATKNFVFPWVPIYSI